MFRVSNISKSFPGVNALTNVSFTVRSGSVHVLCGENGAGKSTIMKILAGMYKPDAGELWLDDAQVHFFSPVDAKKRGIAMIFQELNYFPEITVAEFMYAGSWPRTKLGSVDWKKIKHGAEATLRSEGLQYSVDAKLKELSVSDIQLLEIAKAVHSGARIIIMDEPTSAITQNEADVLLGKIKKLRDEGKSIIYVSHKMDEIFQIADDITVLRDGFLIESGPKDSFTMRSVIAAMVGREMEDTFPQGSAELGDELFSVQNLTSPGAFENVSFYARAGEIVGFAGIIGSGRTEIMRAACGLDRFDSGVVSVRAKKIRMRTVVDSIRRGVAMVSEDRRRYGLIPMRSIRENITLTDLRRYMRGFLRKTKEVRDVREMCAAMNVKAPSIEVPTYSLSGGNQQKVVLSKWIIRDPSVLILDEPTRGIDVGAKYEVYKFMRNFVRQNKTIIMVSSELPELLGMCDRIYVVRSGVIAGEVSRDNFNVQHIMKLATASERVTNT